jgi:transposase
MPKKLNYTLTEEQSKQIENAIAHDPRSEVVRRATAIRLLHQGYSHSETANMVAACRTSVQSWYHRWQAGGIEGLANEPIPGRRPKANGTYEEVLAQALESDPHSYGYPFSVWTVDRLAAHMEQQTGIRLSVGRLGVWLKRWGYVYRQPKADLTHKQDQTVREQVQLWLEELKKQPKTALVDFSLWTKQV